MKRIIVLFVASVTTLLSYAQLPQFSSQSFEDWVYTNPSIPLNQSNILNNKIVLYTTSTGQHLTLTSPPFACYGGQTIDMTVTWITDQWKDEGFDVKKVALTAALLDATGATIDSVTYQPASVSRTNYLDLSITVPSGMTSARLRFAGWKSNVKNSGAVRQIVMNSVLKGDVNLDGEVSVADVNAVIQVLLGDAVAADLKGRADVNKDKEVTVADVNSVIGYILGVS